MPRVPRFQDGGYREAGLRCYYRLRLSLQYHHSSRRSFQATAQSREVPRLRNRSKAEAGDCQADAASEGPVSFLRAFRGTAGDDTETGGYVQLRHSAGGLRTGLSRSIRRPGASGSSLPADNWNGARALQGRREGGRRAVERAWLGTCHPEIKGGTRPGRCSRRRGCPSGRTGLQQCLSTPSTAASRPSIRRRIA